MLDNPQATKEALIQWIRDYFNQNGPSCSAVVGISGGKDSTIVAALCKEALGAERVVGVLMPNGIQSDIDDAKTVVNQCPSFRRSSPTPKPSTRNIRRPT